jgi:hypothetical protein
LRRKQRLEKLDAFEAQDVRTADIITSQHLVTWCMRQVQPPKKFALGVPQSWPVTEKDFGLRSPDFNLIVTHR